MSSVCGASTFVNYAKNLEQLLFKDTNLAGESQNSIKTIVMGGTTATHRNDYARENLQNNVKAYEINPQLPEKDQIIALSRLIPCDWINLTLHRSKRYLDRYTGDDFMRAARAVREQDIQSKIDNSIDIIEELRQYQTVSVVDFDLTELIDKVILLLPYGINNKDYDKFQQLMHDFYFQAGLPTPKPIHIPKGLITKVINMVTKFKDQYPLEIIDLINGTNSEIYQYPRTIKEFTVFRGVTGSVENPPQVGDIEVINFPKSGTFDVNFTLDYTSPYLQKIIVPAGSILAYHPSEDQVIFPSGSVFQVQVAPEQYKDNIYQYTSIYLGSPLDPLLYSSHNEIPPFSIVVGNDQVGSSIDSKQILLGSPTSKSFLENLRENNVQDFEIMEIGVDGNSRVQYKQTDDGEIKQDHVLILNQKVYPPSVLNPTRINYQQNSDIANILAKTVTYDIIENYFNGNSLFRFITQETPNKHKTFLVIGKLMGTQITPAS